MLQHAGLVLFTAVLVGIATVIVRLVAPKWEKRDLPGWLGPTILLAVLGIAVAILLTFG
jgi:hypothetical protein